MNNRELKEIVEKIMEKRMIGFVEFAESLPYNRSTLSTLLNSEEEKKITAKLYSKVKGKYPDFFATESNMNQIPVTADTKEEILGMLKMSLMANIDHAAANKKNAANGDKNAESLQELVRMLGIKLNSQNTEPASRPSPEKSPAKSGQPRRMGTLSGKSKIGSVKKSEKQKGIV